MKKNFKRWLALMLAVTMVAGMCLTHTQGSLWATDGADATVTAGSEATAVNETTGEGAETPAAGETKPQETVQEVEIPAEPPKQETPVEPKEPVVQAPAEEEPAPAPAPEKPVAQAPAAKEEPGAGDPAPQTPAAPEQTPEENNAPADEKEKTYNVTFAKPELDGGVIRVWADGESKTEASYTDAKYVKEVKENTTLYFEIETEGNYKVDAVKDQNGNVLNAESVNGKISTYKMVVTEEKQISTLYKEETQETENEESADEQTPAEDEKQEDDKNADASKPEEPAESEVTENAEPFALYASRADYTVAVDDKITIEDSSRREKTRNHNWQIADGRNNVSLSEKLNWQVTVTGERKGTATIKHTYEYYQKGLFIGQWRDAEKTFAVEVTEVQTEPETPTGTYKVYYYTLVPGKTLNSAGTPDQNWNGMGIGSVTGVNAPNKYENGDPIEGGNHVAPSSYPNITVDGKTYKYAATDSPNADREGYYTIEWIRFVSSDGANAGNNGYNQPIVPNGTPTFHMDGQVKLNEKSVYNVDFRVQEPNDDKFTILPDYSSRQDDGTSERELVVPRLSDKTIDGKVWEFDGWYRDKGCTNKADFIGKITDHTSYYGKYVLNHGILRYDGNGATKGSVEDAEGKPGRGVTVAANGFEKDGYKFTGWNTQADGKGRPYQPKDTYILTKGESVLYAQWAPIEYKIEYILDGGTVTSPNPNTYTAEDSFTLNNPTKEGYNFDGWTGTGLNGETKDVTVSEGSTGDREYTAHWSPREDLSYSVEYYYDGELDSTKTLNVPDQTFGTTIETYPNGNITGYEFDKTENFPLTIGVDEKDNVIKVYYKKISNLTYTVNYLDKATNEPIKTAKTVGNQTFGTVVTAESQKVDINGYNYDSSSTESITVGLNDKENVINLYYTKRNDLSYTVNYLEKGTTNVVHECLVVNDVEFGTEVTAESKKETIAGYNYDSASAESIIVGTGENVLNLYYEKKTDLSYTVKYLEAETKEVLEKEKTVPNRTFGVTYTETAAPIKGYNVVGEPEQSITVVDGENVLTFFYTKKDDLGYVVNYLERNEDGSTTSIQAPKSVGEKTYGEVITVSDEIIEIDGYNYVESEPVTELKIDDDTIKNVINLYYEKRTDLSYTVNYLEKDTNKVLADPQTVEKQTFGTEITAESQRITIAGYNSAGADKESIIIGTDIAKNVINLYYEKRDDLSYTVEYYYNGVRDVSKTEAYYEQTFGDVIETYEDKVIDGYEFDKTEGIPLTIGVDSTANVIKVYYKPVSNLTYTVNYLEKGVDGKEDTVLAEAKEVSGQTFGTVVEAATEVAAAPEIDGYNYPPVAAQTSITIGMGKNVIKLYYEKGYYPYGWTQRDIEIEYNGPGSILGSGGCWQGALYGTEISSEELMKDNNVKDIPGYEFVKANPDPVVIDGILSHSAKTGNHMDLYYQRRSDMVYTVEYFYDGVKADDQTINGENGVYKDPIPYKADKTTTYNGKNYMLQEVVKTGDGTVTLDSTKNIVRVYYVLDNNGPEEKPDEIPDSEEYKVLYEANGGEGTVVDNAIYPEGYKVTAKDNAFTKADSVFAIWDKEGDKIAEGETFVMPANDVTLEAQWKMLTVNKKASTPKDGISYKLGETIYFDIDVTNNGDVDLANVVVTDTLEGAVITTGEGYTVSDNTAQIVNLPAGSTVTVKATYTVQETDMGNDKFTNTATAEGDGTEGTDTTDPIPMDEVDKQLNVDKELTNLDEATGTKDGNKAFALDDTMKFNITVTNAGNQTLNDIEVADVIEDAQIIAGEGYTVVGNKAIISDLEPTENITVKATYEVQEEDLGNPNFKNAATAKADETTGGGETPDPIPVEEKDPNLSVEKTVVNQQDEYQVGDTASYEIVVENTGNITLENVVVEDILQGTNGEVTFKKVDGVSIDGNVATIAKMAPEEVVTLECSYVVTRADAGTALGNEVKVRTEGTGGEAETPTTDVEDIYNLTINYLYADGSVAATPVRAQYLEGETYGYASPTINGYTPNFAFVRSSAAGMPAQDVVINVVYTANPVPVVPTPETPDTPDTPDATPDTTPDGTDETPVAVAETTPEEAEPVGAEVGLDDEGNVEIRPVVEEDVPLANRDLDDHECCVLHFLLMLAAMIIYIAYTRSMKKRQERIAELAEQLETEMLKRKQEKAE